MSRRHSTTQLTLDVVLLYPSIAKLSYTETTKQTNKQTFETSKKVLFNWIDLKREREQDCTHVDLSQSFTI